MRARYPDQEGYVERDGVRIFYEVYGEGDPTLVFVPVPGFTHSRMWKGQIPWLARHFRVLVFDPRGNGRSDRPPGVDRYRVEEHGADALAVMDATGTERAVVVAQSTATRIELWLLAQHPERFSGAAFITPYLPLTPWGPVDEMRLTFTDPSRLRHGLRVVFGTLKRLPQFRSASYRRFALSVPFFEGVRKFNRHYWLRDQRGFLEWLSGTLDFTEPHSTWQIEEAVRYAMETDAETMVNAFEALEIAEGAKLRHREEILAYCSRVRCPVLVIHGEMDVSLPTEWAEALAEAVDGRLILIPDTGHVPQARKPVVVNLALREFTESIRSASKPAAKPAPAQVASPATSPTGGQ